ncbi:MAG: hypothetical protein MK364_06460, partial [Pirellulales bacterium]|nr:hypothetical protein [Pirellulales bacterium]
MRRRRPHLVATLILASLGVCFGDTITVTAAKGTTEATKYRAELTVEFDVQAGKSTPVQMDVEFDAMFPHGVSGLIDPHTIVIKRHVQGKTRTYNVRFAENLYYQNQGWVAWLVDDPQNGGEWTIEFGMRAADGRMAEPQYQPPVGVGDRLCHNGYRWQPISVPG